MSVLEHVPVGALNFERFESVLDPEAWERFNTAAAQAREIFDGRVVWNVNSTARGGGVAEMLVSLLAYARGIGVDSRWVVIKGNDPFFKLTKRIHNNLHGAPGDGGELGDAEREVYESTLEDSAQEFDELVSPGDVVIIHDPQPAGLIPRLRDNDAPLIWRCHVGIDTPNDYSRRAWDFLLPYVRPADAYVFSREVFTWEGLEKDRVVLIPPSIDAFSPKNQDLDSDTVDAILGVAGLNDGYQGSGTPTFTREDGSPGRVERSAQLWEGRPLRHDDRVVLQVSRWDALKDPLGVINGFVEHVAPNIPDAHLAYAGPAVEAVADDPEGVEVLKQAQDTFAGLSDDLKERVHLAALPMDDLQENAAIVNALQRRADIVVQKSIAEGFGLTVAEAMWKARPVVASRIGGIQDQITDGESGVLLDDATDLEAYGTAVCRLLADPEGAAKMGEAAQERVRERFLGTRSLMQYLELNTKLLREKQVA